MEPTLLPEQKKQLASWVDQRDSILADIAILKPQKEKLSDEVKNLAASRTEISDKIQQAIGRLQVIDKQEEIRAGLVTKENSELISQKSVLQAEVASLSSEITVLSDTKIKLKDDIDSFLKINNIIFTNISNLEKVAIEVIDKCYNNAKNVSEIIQPLVDKCKEIISLSTVNIEAHREVLNEIPRLFVELKKKSLERPVIINKNKTHE